MSPDSQRLRKEPLGTSGKRGSSSFIKEPVGGTVLKMSPQKHSQEGESVQPLSGPESVTPTFDSPTHRRTFLSAFHPHPVGLSPLCSNGGSLRTCPWQHGEKKMSKVRKQSKE